MTGFLKAEPRQAVVEGLAKPESASEHIRNARQMVRDQYFACRDSAPQDFVNLLVSVDTRLDQALRQIKAGNP